MASSWSIEIIAMPDGTVAFRPDIGGAVLGQPLGVNRGDNVTWNNKTNRSLQLKSINPPNIFLTDLIPAGQVSSPIFNVSTTTPTIISYSCQNPAQQTHSIQIVS